MPAASDWLTLGLMTKYWDAGEVKTRLGAAIGMQRAAALHRLFVAHLCRGLATVADRRIVCLAPPDRLDAFRKQLVDWDLGQPWQVIPQGNGDLGSRMQSFFTHCLADVPQQQPSRAVLVGADCPTLAPEEVERAGELLRDHDVVLGPAVDGGYYLIGIRGPWHARHQALENLFCDVPWSTDRVLSVTRERLVQSGLRVHELATREDIDSVDELSRLRNQLDGQRGPRAELGPSIERVLGDPSLADRCAQ